jgi:diamine N-acetyltransferase
VYQSETTSCVYIEIDKVVHHTLNSAAQATNTWSHMNSSESSILNMLKEHRDVSAHTSHMDETARCERPPLNLLGAKVALGPLRRDLIPLYQQWFNNFELLRTLDRQLKPVSLDQVERWFEARATSAQIGSVVVFTIYERGTWRPIGNTALEAINLRDRTAEFGIFIGESDLQGKGYGSEATRLMLDYAFTGLGLQNIMLRVWEFNLAGIRVYEKAGFREFGRRSRAHLLNGEWWDDVYMQILADDFTSPVLEKIFTSQQESTG